MSLLGQGNGALGAGVLAHLRFFHISSTDTTTALTIVLDQLIDAQDPPQTIPVLELRSLQLGIDTYAPPDLTISSWTATAALGAGCEELTLTATCANISATGNAGSSRLGFYLSTDAVIDVADFLVGTVDLPGDFGQSGHHRLTHVRHPGHRSSRRNLPGSAGR